MNWVVFSIALLFAGALDRTFLAVFEVKGIVPMVTPALVAFVAMHAPRPTAVWAGCCAGLVMDLLNPVPTTFGAVVVPGPWAIGLALAAWTGIQLRGVLFRRSPAAFALLTACTALLASLLWTFVFSIRGWYPAEGFPWPGSALGNLGTRTLDAFASGLLAVPLWWPLERWIGWWNFPLPALRRR